MSKIDLKPFKGFAKEIKSCKTCQKTIHYAIETIINSELFMSQLRETIKTIAIHHEIDPNSTEFKKLMKNIEKFAF